jgi:hypothetical protein
MGMFMYVQVSLLSRPRARQLYRIGSLHPRRHPVAATVFGHEGMYTVLLYIKPIGLCVLNIA